MSYIVELLSFQSYNVPTANLKKQNKKPINSIPPCYLVLHIEHFEMKNFVFLCKLHRTSALLFDCWSLQRSRGLLQNVTELGKRIFILKELHHQETGIRQSSFSYLFNDHIIEEKNLTWFSNETWFIKIRCSWTRLDILAKRVSWDQQRGNLNVLVWICEFH